MIVIYHNPRCSKSRESLEILETKKADHTVFKYLDEPLSTEKLGKIIKLLNIKPIELIRKNEAIWKSDYKGKDLSDAQVINAMVSNPKLIERPIVINGKQAVIGRPPATILDII